MRFAGHAPEATGSHGLSTENMRGGLVPTRLASPLRKASALSVALCLALAAPYSHAGETGVATATETATATATAATGDADAADAAARAARKKSADGATTLDAMNVAATTVVNDNELAKKKNASVLVDSIDRDSIQVHAQDDSIAQRLMLAPGISVTRDEDQPRYITVRGIESNLNSTTLDGMTMASVGDEGGGARSINLQLIPSDIADRIDVYKTFSAEQNPDGIGGAINLVSNSAFDFAKNTLHVDANVNHHDLENDGGHNAQPKTRSLFGDGVNAKYSTIFGADDEFGITVSARHQAYNANQNKLFQTSQYFYDEAGANIAGPNAASGWNGLAAPYNIAYYADDRRVKTYGGSVKLEWWPANGPVRASLMAYGYGMEEQRTENGFEFDAAKSVSGQTATTGTTPVQSLNAIFGNKNWARNNQGLIGNVEWRGDDSFLRFTGGYSRDRVNVDQANMKLTATPNGDPSMAYASDGRGEIFNMTTLADPSIIGNSAYKVSSANTQQTQGVAGLGDARVDFAKNTDAGAQGFGIAAGAEYKRMHVATDYTQQVYANGADLTGDLYSPGNFVFPKAVYPLPFFDYPAFLAKGGWSTLPLNATSSLYNSQASDFGYSEKVKDAYLSLHYATPVVEAVLGVRYDDTTYVADTPTINNGVVAGKAKSEGSYHYPLPSLNVTTHVTDDTNVRVSLSRTIGRPVPSNIAQAQVETCGDNAECTISMGNPQLKPEKSFNMDASIEHYFNDGKAYASLAWFKKNIQSDIVSVSSEATDEFGRLVTIVRPENVDDSSVQGMEFSLVSRDMALAGQRFDLMFNATHMDGQMSYTSATGPRTIYQLLNQPRNIANLGATWHLPWLDSRLTLTENFTDRYLITIGANPWQDRGFRQRYVTDASWDATFDDHWSASLSAANLFGKDQYETVGDHYQYMRNLNNYGRTYYLHVKYDLN
ncbi:TonB-dependent receptor [Bacillus sp. NP157]|nr:TonB-dependent receptor [Bacillus sp. NP157]